MGPSQTNDTSLSTISDIVYAAIASFLRYVLWGTKASFKGINGVR